MSLRTWTLTLLAAASALTACDGTEEPRADASRASKGPPPLFVAPNGRDSNPGTKRRPFRTLAHALRELRAGDRLYVRGGAYTERVKVAVAPGRPRARVLVSSFARERPLVKGQLWIGNPSYWTIHGIDVTWARGNPDEPMARVYGGTGWRFTGAEIWGARSTSGLHVDDGPLNNLGSWTVKGNCIHDTHPTHGQNQDHNLYVDDMGSSPNPRGVVARNLMFNAVNGRGIKLGPGDSSGGAFDVRVRYNTIVNSAQNVGISRDSSGVRIYRNILVSASEANVLGFELDGRGNVVRNNVGADAPSFLANTGGSRPLVDGGGNRRARSLEFDSIGCRGLHSGLIGYGAHG